MNDQSRLRLRSHVRGIRLVYAEPVVSKMYTLSSRLLARLQELARSLSAPEDSLMEDYLRQAFGLDPIAIAVGAPGEVITSPRYVPSGKFDYRMKYQRYDYHYRKTHNIPPVQYLEPHEMTLRKISVAVCAKLCEAAEAADVDEDVMAERVLRDFLGMPPAEIVLPNVLPLELKPGDPQKW